MKIFLRILFFLFGLGLLVYLAWPAPSFPSTLWDFQASTEPADHESPLRRGYYTNLTREQLMAHYAKQFGWGERLNYPPENAQTLIRDQTKATFLEEVVHPMRESLFVSGNELAPGMGDFEIDGKKFKNKVIVKYVPSNVIVREALGIAVMGLIWMVLGEVGETFSAARKYLQKNK